MIKGRVIAHLGTNPIPGEINGEGQDIHSTKLHNHISFNTEVTLLERKIATVLFSLKLEQRDNVTVVKVSHGEGWFLASDFEFFDNE